MKENDCLTILATSRELPDPGTTVWSPIRNPHPRCGSEEKGIETLD